MYRLGFRLTATTTKVSVSSAVPHFRSRSAGTRWLHQRQPLPYPVESGLGKFLPSNALQVQLEYQDGLLERLNEEVVGTADEASSVAQTVINLSGKQDKILAFSYASLALNNSFFLNNLKPPSKEYPNYEHEIASTFGGSIRLAYGNVQQLRSAFSAAALGMFTNGWIWFVMDQAGHTGIVPTYGAGTLLIRSRSSMEYCPGNSRTTTDHPSPLSSPTARPSPPGTPPASPLSGISGDTSPSIPRSPQSQSRFYYSDVSSQIMSPAIGIHSPYGGSKQRTKAVEALNAGEILYPLFCIPVFERAWMSAGYGVWGREQWLKEFWSVLNWRKVDATYMAIHDAIVPKRPN